MIEPEDLEGRTHYQDFEEEIPEVVTGTLEYTDLAGRLDSSVEADVYERFSDKTDDLMSALDEFFEELQSALYGIDNGSPDLARDSLDAAKDRYDEARQAYTKLESDEYLDLELPGRVDEYFDEIRTGLESVEDMLTPEKDVTASTDRERAV